MRPSPGDGFQWVELAPGPALRCAALDPFATHVFTTRPWSLGAPDGDRAAAWREVAAAVDVDGAYLARARQVHGAAAVVAQRESVAHEPLPEADILLTSDRACAVAIQTADCVPILFADRRTGAAAAAHAGWRGLAARVPAAATKALATRFGSRPEDLVVAIGPAICGSRYEVGVDVWNRFRDARFPPPDYDRWFAPGDRPEHWWFDGARCACDQLIAAGVPDADIHVSTLCTAEHPDLLCSYRRDGKAAGRMAAAIRPR